ncbi:extensin isoform X2 [Anoplophora glabripennis]|uniref:extensin isoform X2 n=1 Tax=Anoplophora glabripennis TaxID=217634 RepID=UPI00087556C0|nr:extensin isoform X2 [Anoplophora glabripennis]
MDVFMPIAICVIFLILFAICGWCCKRKREGTVYGQGPNVTVTTQHSSAVVAPPYPIADRHPIPQTCGPAAPGFATHTPPYPTHTPHPQPGISPYPPTGGITHYAPATGGTPYPPGGATPYPPGGVTPYPPGGVTPYPPDGHGNYSANPPPYDVAVSSPPVQPLPVKEGYGKQAPYNPNYS